MTDRAWKAFERRLAHDVGTERIPVTGEREDAIVLTGWRDFAGEAGLRQERHRVPF